MFTVLPLVPVWPDIGVLIPELENGQLGTNVTGRPDRWVRWTSLMSWAIKSSEEETEEIMFITCFYVMFLKCLSFRRYAAGIFEFWEFLFTHMNIRLHKVSYRTLKKIISNFLYRWMFGYFLLYKALSGNPVPVDCLFCFIVTFMGLYESELTIMIFCKWYRDWGMPAV